MVLEMRKSVLKWISYIVLCMSQWYEKCRCCCSVVNTLLWCYRERERKIGKKNMIKVLFSGTGLYKLANIVWCIVALLLQLPCQGQSGKYYITSTRMPQFSYQVKAEALWEKEKWTRWKELTSPAGADRKLWFEILCEDGGGVLSEHSFMCDGQRIFITATEMRHTSLVSSSFVVFLAEVKLVIFGWVTRNFFVIMCLICWWWWGVGS